jgi:hypothetical protein
MPKPRKRSPQDEEHIQLVRSCHEELVKIRQAIEKSAEISSAFNATIVLLTIAVFLTGFIAILRDYLPETFRPIISAIAGAVMLLALYGAYLTIPRLRRVRVNPKKEEVNLKE